MLITAPYLSHASGNFQHIQIPYRTFEEREAFAQKFMKENINKIVDTHRVIGACLVFKREVIILIGGNDFWYGLGQFDDDDWCIAQRAMRILKN